MISAKKLGLLGLSLVTVAVVATFAACGDDDEDDDGNGGSADLTELQEQVAKTQVLAAMTVFRVEELHAIDESSQTASEIEAGWSGQVERMHNAMLSVTWPDDMKTDADTLTATLDELHAAIEEEDLAGVKELSTQAHDEWHDFEHVTGAFLRDEEHTEEDDRGDEATDAAEETSGT